MNHLAWHLAHGKFHKMMSMMKTGALWGRKWGRRKVPVPGGFSGGSSTSERTGLCVQNCDIQPLIMSPLQEASVLGGRHVKI